MGAYVGCVVWLCPNDDNEWTDSLFIIIVSQGETLGDAHTIPHTRQEEHLCISILK